MKIIAPAILALALTTGGAANACETMQTAAPDGFTYVRARPSTQSEPLWRLGNGVVVFWCGRTANSGNTQWKWVMTGWKSEMWAHKGWISSRLLEREGIQTITRQPTPTFENGGE